MFVRRLTESLVLASILTTSTTITFITTPTEAASTSGKISATKSTDTVKGATTVKLSADSLANINKIKKIQKRAVDEVIESLRTHYGILIYKNQLFSVDLEQLEAKYYGYIERAELPHETSTDLAKKTYKQTRIVLSRSDLEQILIALAAELKDGHTNIDRQMRGGWSTGIVTKNYDGGKLFVQELDSEIFAEDRSVSKIKAGDEILAIDGISVQELSKRNMVYSQLATFDTQYQVAIENLLIVPAFLYPAKKDGAELEIVYKHPDSTKLYTASLSWTKISPIDPNQRLSLSQLTILKAETLKGSKSTMARSLGAKASLDGMGGKNSDFKKGIDKIKTKLGEIEDVGSLINQMIKKEPSKLLQYATKQTAKIPLATVERLEAYTVLHEGKRIGVLRIPDYIPDSNKAFREEVAWIRLVLTYFNKTTEGLIIDQLSNGGGYVSYVAVLLGMFANNEKLKTYSLDLKISQTMLNGTDYFDSSDQLFNSNLTNLQLNQESYNYLKNLFEKGITMSGPVPVLGTAAQSPTEKIGVAFPDDGAAFQKKVLILNNRESASGGDFFPFALQGNDRAKIFGSTSMGLGGPVFRSDESKTSAEISMRSAFGIARFHKGTHIENVGAVPDYIRNTRSDDVTDEFKLYATQALDTAVMYFNGTTDQAIKNKLYEALPKGTSEQYKDLAEQQKKLKQLVETSMNELDMIEKFNILLKKFATSLNSSGSTLDSQTLESLQIDLPKFMVARDEVLASLNSNWAVAARLEEILKRYKNQDNLTANEQMYLQKVWGRFLDDRKVTAEITKLAKLLKFSEYFFIRPTLRDKNDGGVLRPATCSALFVNP